MGAAVVVEDLRKSYGDRVAVDGLTFAIEEGEVFALLGPNGAGKTTTVEILEGHRLRNGGHVSVLGHDPAHGTRAFRESIGIVLQEGGIDGVLTVGEAVRLFGGFYRARAPRRGTRAGRPGGRPRPAGPVALRRPATAAGPRARARRRSPPRLPRRAHDGLRPRGPARGLAGHRPPAAQRAAIVLTSHYMDEVQQLADRVLVVAGGRAVAEGTPDLLGRTSPVETLISFELPSAAAAALLPERLARQADVDGGASASPRSMPSASSTSSGMGARQRDRLARLEVREPSLEDVYLEITGQVGDAT